VKRSFRTILLALIATYRRFVSPAFGRRCKYEPTCSAYAAEAVREHGPLRGSLMGLWRLARCNPFSHGGFDPVPPRGCSLASKRRRKLSRA
jgi:putative membrane protein insertion efficiency factor